MIISSLLARSLDLYMGKKNNFMLQQQHMWLLRKESFTIGLEHES